MSIKFCVGCSDPIYEPELSPDEGEVCECCAIEEQDALKCLKQEAFADGWNAANSEPETVISAGIDAAQGVVDAWESGDLAEAVNALEDWAVQAADYLPDSEPDEREVA